MAETKGKKDDKGTSRAKTDEKSGPAKDPLAEATVVENTEQPKPNDPPDTEVPRAERLEEMRPGYATVNDNAPDGGPIVEDD